MRSKAFISVILAVTVPLSMFCFILPIGASNENSSDNNIYRSNKNKYMKIALTFDDGPHPRYTHQILDILDDYKIKATFFVIGVNADNYPNTLSDIIERGHEIGNHTYSHPHVSKITSEDLRNEIEKCEASIYCLTDCKTKLFRPPEGMLDNSISKVIGNLDYTTILWDIDTRDWAHTPPADIASNIIENISSGDIILMHDYISYDSPTPDALRLFIPNLIQRGFNFVVVSELIGTQ